ncbi:MAG: hypothetical protein ACTHL8_26650 [Burkholderiaceae bacterium]
MAADRDPEPRVAVCATFEDARQLAETLAAGGLDPAQLSVVGSREGLPDAPSMEARLRKWSRLGSLWGALGGLAAGVVLAVPAVGAVVASGPIAAMLLVAAEGAVLGSGLSAIAAALTGMGLASDDAIACEADIAARRFLVLVHGSHDQVADARARVLALARPGVRVAA